MELLAAPVHALIAFFHVSVMGALGYSVGVIGFVLIPGAYYVLAKLRAPPWVAAPAAAVVAIYLGGAGLALVMGGMGFDDIETHALALARVNGCARATEALGAPIRQTGVTGGSYETRGAAGDSSWELEVEGPRHAGIVRYAAERHGGAWALTALAMKVDDQLVDLAGCRDAETRATSLRVAAKDVIGLWGEQHGNQLVLTRLAADGSFVAGGFTDAALVFRVRGTWEVTDAGIVWHASKAGAKVPAGYWEQMGEARIAADVNPIVELSPSRWVYQEMDGRRTEVIPMDPARLGTLVEQLDAP